jgi:sialidase-1
MLLQLLLLLCRNGAAAQQTATISAGCDSDFASVSRGSQLEGAPPYHYWRTGSPHQAASLTLTDELAPGAVVESVSFAYRYLAAYGPGADLPNISVALAGAVVFQSGPLDPKYNYSVPSNHTGYSPPIAAKAATNLPLTVPAAGGQLEVAASNNDWNLQILLPLELTITCRAGGPCAKASAWRPAPPTVVLRGGDKGPAGTDETNTTGGCFRIPELAAAPDGSLLAFAEGRYSGCHPDVSPNTRIVMRRSLDGGKGEQWGPIQVLWGKTPAERLRGLNYPTPIVDRRTGKVSVFFFQSGCGKACPQGGRCAAGRPGGGWDNVTGSAGGCCGCPAWRVTSTDSGRTWSSPPDNMTAVSGGTFGATGGGSGIQLPDGKLVFACGGTACWSKDGGDKWTKGALAPLGPGVAGFGEETLVADGRTNASLALFIRSGSKGGGQAGRRGSPLINHAVASSLDGGATWGPARLLPSVIGVTCQGSIAAAGGAKVANGQVLLSAPYSHDLSGYGQNGRENMAVWTYRLNETNTAAAGPDPEPELVARLFPCKAAYSSFSEDGQLNLFEGGPEMRYQTIMLARLNTTFPSPN